MKLPFSIWDFDSDRGVIILECAYPKRFAGYYLKLTFFISFCIYLAWRKGRRENRLQSWDGVFLLFCKVWKNGLNPFLHIHHCSLPMGDYNNIINWKLLPKNGISSTTETFIFNFRYSHNYWTYFLLLLQTPNTPIAPVDPLAAPLSTKEDYAYRNMYAMVNRSMPELSPYNYSKIVSQLQSYLPLECQAQNPVLANRLATNMRYSLGMAVSSPLLIHCFESIFILFYLRLC